MPIQQTLNERPAVAAGATVALILLAGLITYFSLANGSSPGTSSKAYFTVDDGQTYFADDATKAAPFDHEGKQAVRAYVFECDGKKFVNHLERYTPAGKKSADDDQAAMRAGKAPPHVLPNGVPFREVKKPGDKIWIDSASLGKSGPIMAVHCPSGGTGEPTLVEP